MFWGSGSRIRLNQSNPFLSVRLGSERKLYTTFHCDPFYSSGDFVISVWVLAVTSRPMYMYMELKLFLFSKVCCTEMLYLMLLSGNTSRSNQFILQKPWAYFAMSGD